MPPGRDRLATRPQPIGSPDVITIGISEVACRAARAGAESFELGLHGGEGVARAVVAALVAAGAVETDAHELEADRAAGAMVAGDAAAISSSSGATRQLSRQSLQGATAQACMAPEARSCFGCTVDRARGGVISSRRAP